MALKYKIVIPTRDSARWIAGFLSAYRALGVEPLYLVDTRCSDDTAAILTAAGARVEPMHLERSFVEGVLPKIPALISENWVLRLDDDEFPSHALLEWLQHIRPQPHTDAFGLSRRELMIDAGTLHYSQLEDFYFDRAAPLRHNPHQRLYRPASVAYEDRIHTSGIIPQSQDYAPQDAYFVHFDWILRSAEERVEKLRRYERTESGAGWKFAHFYLPELHSRDDLRLLPLETSEFDALVAQLPQHENPDRVLLSLDEIKALTANPFGRDTHIQQLEAKVARLRQDAKQDASSRPFRRSLRSLLGKS